MITTVIVIVIIFGQVQVIVIVIRILSGQVIAIHIWSGPNHCHCP